MARTVLATSRMNSTESSEVLSSMIMLTGALLQPACIDGAGPKVVP
jgi:hypothetical protein